MNIDLSAIPRQSWFDLCQLAVKYATEEKAALREPASMKGGEHDNHSADPAARKI